jgi:hypothetical protein
MDVLFSLKILFYFGNLDIKTCEINKTNIYVNLDFKENFLLENFFPKNLFL